MAKRPTKLSIDATLLQQARGLDINLSATIEVALQRLIRCRQRENWLAENAEAVDAYNQRIEQHGTFSDRLCSQIWSPDLSPDPDRWAPTDI